MDTIFMNSYDPHRLLLNLLDKIKPSAVLE